MLCVTAGCEIKNCSAVREKFSVFAAETKRRSCIVSIARRITQMGQKSIINKYDLLN
jgi:hypothetical protein